MAALDQALRAIDRSTADKVLNEEYSERAMSEEFLETLSLFFIDPLICGWEIEEG